MSELSADRDPFEVVAESFLERFRAGQRPSIEEYAARHPELADQIRELLPALVMVEQDLTVDRHPASGGSRVLTSPSSFKEWRLGDYRILREVGRGGMGVVYEAEQVSLGRRVALKVLPGHLAGDVTASERFRREAKAAARLHHTNIVPVFEVGRDGEVAYYAMQFIRGQGLDQIVEELRRLREPGRQANGHDPAGSGGREGAVTVAGPRRDGPSDPQGRALDQTMGMLLTGSLAAEGSGVSGRGEDTASGLAGTGRFDPAATSGPRPDAPRRDVRPAPTAPGPSPSAVLPGGKHVSEVDTSGPRRPYFRSVAQIGRQAAQGLAYAHARGVVHRDIKPSNLLLDTEGVVWITDFGLAKADDDGLTASGDLLGTLRYMAPERFRGEGDARADVYALGLTLYELLTLRPAYDSTDRLRLIERIKNEEPIRPRSVAPRIPRDLQTIVLKAIDKHPDHRYQTADALSEDLRRFLADEPIKARQISTSERYWRWARRNPAVASLVGVLTAVLVLVTFGSLLAAARFSVLADRNEKARVRADRARGEAETARAAADASEAVAMREKEVARKALAKSQLDLAEKEFELGKFVEARKILDEMPESFRDSNWRFLQANARDFAAELIVPGKGSVEQLSILPQGDRFVARSFYKAMGVFTLEGRQVGDWIPGNTADRARVWSSFGVDGAGARLAFAASDEEVAVHDLATCKPLYRWASQVGTIFRVVLSPDGETVLACGGAKTSAHATRTGAPLWSRPSISYCSAFSTDGRSVAVLAGQSGPSVKVEILDTRTGALRRTLEATGDNPGWKSGLQFSRSGDALACLGGDELILWDAGTGVKRRALHFPGEKVDLLSPDGAAVATTRDGRIRLWDTGSGRLLRSLNGSVDTEVMALAFSPDGRTLLSSHLAGLEGKVEVWPTRLREEIAAVGPASSQPHALRFDRAGTRLYASATGVVEAWDPQGQLRHWNHRAAAGYLGDLAVHPADGSVLLSELDTPAFTHFNSTGEPLKSFGVNHGSSLEFSHSGRLLLTVDNAFNYDDPGWAFTVMEYPTGVVLRRIPFDRPRQPYAAFCLDDSAVATAARGGGITVWDWKAGAPLRRIDASQTGSIGCLAASPDGRHLATGGPDRWVRVWEASTGRLVSAFRAHWDGVRCLRFSPDGTEILSGGEDGTIRVDGAFTGERRLVIYGFTRPVHDVTASPDGTLIAAIAPDEPAKVWDRKTCVSAATTAPAEGRARPTVPVIRAGRLDPAELARVGDLLNSGVASFGRGSYDEAVTSLQRASEKIQELRRHYPADATLVSPHGVSLGYLAGTLRELKRTGEALERSRESLAVYESMAAPQSGDFYNMACGYAMVSALDLRASTGDRERLRARAVDCLRRAVERDKTRILPLIPGDRDLDPLRDRADFRGMMADARFPSDPFAQPSPMATAQATPAERRIKGEALIAGGRTLEAIPHLASARERNSGDSLLLLRVAALLAWFHRDAELAATCRKARDFARDTGDAGIADATAKSSSLRPPDDPTYRAATLALARLSYDLGKGTTGVGWYRLGLGIAEYRAGHDEAAAETLRSMIGDGQAPISVTSAFYLAMSLSRHGKDDEARRVAAEAISRMRPLPIDEANPLAGGANHDHLILWMACKEATALLKLDSAPARKAVPKGK